MTDASSSVLPLPSREAALVERMQEGDRDAFALLIEMHQRAVLAACIRLLDSAGGEPDAAQDVAQEVFLTFWRERGSYVERGTLRAYLLRIARLRCLALRKRRRSRWRLGLVFGRTEERAVDTAGAADARLDAASLRGRLRRLPPEQADLILLRHGEGLSIAEIQELTGVPAGTIKSRINRGLLALREELP